MDQGFGTIFEVFGRVWVCGGWGGERSFAASWTNGKDAQQPDFAKSKNKGA